MLIWNFSIVGFILKVNGIVAVRLISLSSFTIVIDYSQFIDFSFFLIMYNVCVLSLPINLININMFFSEKNKKQKTIAYLQSAYFF